MIQTMSGGRLLVVQDGRRVRKSLQRALHLEAGVELDGSAPVTIPPLA